MPYLELITNVSDDLITNEFRNNLGNAFSKSFDRPREKCLVFVKAGWFNFSHFFTYIFTYLIN